MTILAIGAHPDDIELGCGGALAKHAALGQEVTMLIVTNGQAGPGDVLLREAESREGAKLLGANVIFGDLPDGTVSNHELRLVHLIEDAVRETNAAVVYTHGAKDSHQDHRAVALASMGACRAVQQVLCYDSPSSLGFNPTVFVDISHTLEQKLAALECHTSQVSASPMADPQLVRTQGGYRGFQARCAAAEGFEPLRLVLPISN